MSDIKLALIAPEFLPNWGGVGTYCVELAKHMPEEIEMHVVTLQNPKEDSNTFSKRFDALFKNNIHYHLIGKAGDPFISNAKFQFAIWKKMSGLTTENGIELIHANHALMSDILLKLRKRSVPSITTIHTTIGSQHRGTLDSGVQQCLQEPSERNTARMMGILRAAERFYLKRTENIICVSGFIEEWIKKDFGEFRSCEVINNGVDTKHFRPQKRDEAVLKFPKVKEIDGPIVLFSGRLLAMKGIYTFLEAAKSLIKSGVKAHFVIAGAGDQKGVVEFMEESHLPRKNFSILGQIPYESMPNLYNIADIYTVPSFTESFPMCVLESMACGKPVIASRVGGIPEIIEDGKTGILCPPGNSEKLACNMRMLLDDGTTRERLGNEARNAANNRFSAAIMTSKTVDYYKKVLEEQL